jgi:ectoine hydroxylase-related dioxygenase (phytanoyl-CoA dioxygenase family)
MNQHGTVLTGAHHEAFRRDGVVKVEGAVDPSWIGRMLDLADAQLTSPGRWVGDSAKEGGPGRLFTDRYLWRDVPAVRDFVFGSGVARLAGELLESQRVRFYFDHLLVKEPHTPNPTPWHQDIPYWPFLGRQIASVWVSATDLTVEESSLEFIRGSHRWDKYFTPKAFTTSGSKWAEANAGDELPDIEAARDDFDVIGFDVKAGDALVFSAWTVHGSPGNAGDRRRVALSTRWLGDDATWDPRPAADPSVTQADTTAVPGRYPDDDDRFPVGWQRDA